MTCQTPGCDTTQKFLHERMQQIGQPHINVCCICNACALEPEAYCYAHPQGKRKR